MRPLTPQQKRMKELMGFTYEDNSHDILSEQFIMEQTRIGSKLKNLEIFWGDGKTITLRKGKNANKKLSQEKTQPTQPVEEWDEFLKKDKKMVSLMGVRSKRYWNELKSSEDPLEKGFAVASLEEFKKTYQKNKWTRVSLGKETVEEDIPEDKEYPAIEMTIPLEGQPSSDFYDDNQWEPTTLLKQTVQDQIIDPVLEWMGGKKECDGAPLVYLNDITIKTSASRFRNGIKMSWLDLSKNRNDATLNYIEDKLKNIGVSLDGNTVITQEFTGDNGDGTSGPNPGKTPEGKQYAISTDGNNDNTIETYTSEIINQFGTPLNTKEEYDKYKYCIVTLTLVLNDCGEEDPEGEITTLEVDNYSIKFRASRPSLEITLPRFKWNWIKKQKNKNKQNKYRKVKCPKFTEKTGKKKRFNPGIKTPMGYM